MNRKHFLVLGALSVGKIVSALVLAAVLSRSTHECIQPETAKTQKPANAELALNLGKSATHPAPHNQHLTSKTHSERHN